MIRRARRSVSIRADLRSDRCGGRLASVVRGVRRAVALTALGMVSVLAVLGPAPAAHAAAGPWHENPQSRVRLITPYEIAPAAGEILLGLQFTAIPGWHLYWKNSGDAGYPPAVDFSPTSEVHDAELLWPSPERYELPGGLVAFGYQREVVYPIRARMAAAGGGSITLTADLDYLVCEIDCVPYSYRLSLQQPIGPTGSGPGSAQVDEETEPLLTAWLRRLPTPVEQAAGIATRDGLDLGDSARPALVVEVIGEAARRARRPDLFLASHDLFTAGAPRLTRTAEGLRFRVPLAYRLLPAAPPAAARFDWTITGLDEEAGGPLAVEAVRTVPLMPIAPPLVRLREWIGRAGRLSSALLAVAALATMGLALYGWGLLGGGAEGRRREASGFVALAVALGLLYALGSRLSAEGLAAFELVLLAACLVAWLRRRTACRRLSRAVLSCALVLLAALAVWLATRSRVAESIPAGGQIRDADAVVTP